MTTLTTGEVNRRDGLADVIVGIVGPDGPQALVYEWPEGALKGQPEVLALPAPATALALGQLDESYAMDLAVAVGSELLVVHGRDRRLSVDEKYRGEVPPASIDQHSFPFFITSLALGDFIPDQHGRLDMALLADNGTVRVLAKSTGNGQQATGKYEAWSVVGGQWSVDGGVKSGATQLVRVKVSSRPTDELVVLDQANHKLHVLTPHPAFRIPRRRLRSSILNP